VGVPAANRRAQCRREGDGTCGALSECVEATGLAIAGTSVLAHESWSTFGWIARAKSWRDREKRP